MSNKNGLRASLTPRTSFLVFMCLAAGAADTNAGPAESARLGELLSQEQIIRDLVSEVEEQIDRTTGIPDSLARNHARMLAGLKNEYLAKLDTLTQQRIKEESRPVLVTFSGLLDVHFDPGNARSPLMGVQFDRAVEDQDGLEMLRFVSRDGRREWLLDPAQITGIRASDPAEGAD
jgi:hypothetical protein